ncbi:MAG: hypothetical protein IKC69_01910 [Clostridia bacterium]|nr:hypothetical protein [Clostridia bacterium]
MASIYRFSRKSKKEDPEAAKVNTGDSEEEISPPALLSLDETEAETEAAQSLAEDPEATREVFADKAEEPEDRISEKKENEADQKPFVDKNEAESTRSFDIAEVLNRKNEEEKAKGEATEIPEELLRALQADREKPKVDDVFTRGVGTVSAESSKEEYDATAALLMEVFGSGAVAKKKKKQKDSPEPGSSTEEIQSVFHDTKTLQEALSEAAQERGSEEKSDDYVAIHDSETEITKEYHATFSIEEELEKIQPEEETRSREPELADEVRVSDQDNPYSDTLEELEEKVERPTGLPEEFTTPEEYDEFAEHLRGRNYKTMMGFVWSFVILLVLFYLESATFSDFPHPEILSPGGTYNSVIYLLADIQLVLLAALVSLSSLGSGLRALFSGKPDRNSVSVLMVLFSVVHPVILLATGTQEYPLFGSLTALFLTVGAIAEFLDSKRIYRTFRVFGRRGDKLVAKHLTEDCPEAEAFREQLKGDPKFYSVQKTSFVTGFFGGLDAPGKADRSFGYSILLCLILSVSFAAFHFWKAPGLVECANAFAATAAMTFPLSGIFTVSLPFSHLSKKAEKRSVAILSPAAADEYAACDVVSFTDKEIFPPKSVKVTTIRTYGQTRIDKAILYGAMIFQKLGGPLSLVFKKTISGVYTEIPENFDFLEITADGMCAKIDGKDVFVGNKNYLLSYDFGYTKDAVDEGFEAKSGKIMYMVIGSELAAKFYIRYSISRRFKKTILALFKCGICPAVKTCDPNIDSDLFRTLLQNDKIPAGIIKTCDAMKDAPSPESAEAGMVCNSSIANLLYGFSLCDSLRHLSRANTVIKTLSALVGVGVVLFMHFFMGGISQITGLFVLVYQLLWLIPVIIPSLSE